MIKRHQVIGIQHRVVRDRLQPVRPLAADVAIGPEQDADVAEVGADPADRLGAVVVQAIRPVVVLGHQRGGQIWLEERADRDRAGAGAAAAVGAGEGLVRVIVHEVGPHVPRPDLPEDRVHVRAIEVEQPPSGVEQLGDRLDLGVE